MSLIKLDDKCYVATDEIAEITVNDYSDQIAVHMKSGLIHNVGAAYGQSIYRTLDRLVAEVNAANQEQHTK